MKKETSWKKFWRKTFQIVLILGSIVLIERFCYMQTAGFRLAKIQPDRSFYSDKRLPSSFAQDRETLQLLDQPFFFLGSGVQSYAFISEDEKIVLKFFKHYHSFPSTAFLEKLPLPSPLDRLRKKVLLNRETRMNHIFKSCEIAFNELPKETGVIYIHLRPTSRLNKDVHIFDKLGIHHSIDLDSIPFVLQIKAELIYPKLQKLLKQNDQSGAKRCIDSILDRIVGRCQKGIVNSDPIIRRNFGFIGEEAVEIDIGSFNENPFVKKPYSLKKELFFETLELKQWLEQNNLELATYLDEKINVLLG
ncbi:MAG: hypothetical protein ACM3JI_05895 [Anaerolineae bacterium]